MSNNKRPRQKSTYTLEELLKSREEGNSKFINECHIDSQKVVLERIAGRSGIMPIHQNCRFDNYQVLSEGHARALKFSKWYANNFKGNKGQSFVFSGNTGTGKNHLAAAICNSLMERRLSCLVITITELMIKMRSCYNKNSEITEEKFINGLINVDLLVIDEIGLQRGNTNENLLINQLVDSRLGRLKPTGMLTNLGKDDITALIGERVMNRMKENKGQWITFDWGSFRK